MKKLTDDISAVKPTLFVAVPRVLERIQSGIQAKLKAKPWIVRTIVGLAYRWKLSKLKAGVPLNRVSHTAPLLKLGVERGNGTHCDDITGNMATAAIFVSGMRCSNKVVKQSRTTRSACISSNRWLVKCAFPYV